MFNRGTVTLPRRQYAYGFADNLLAVAADVIGKGTAPIMHVCGGAGHTVPYFGRVCGTGLVPATVSLRLPLLPLRACCDTSPFGKQPQGDVVAPGLN